MEEVKGWIERPEMPVLPVRWYNLMAFQTTSE
jgi:hypothetical protein